MLQTGILILLCFSGFVFLFACLVVIVEHKSQEPSHRLDDMRFMSFPQYMGSYTSLAD